MTTENDEWRPRNRYNENGPDAEGQNRVKRPYQSYNRPNNYGNYQSGNYNNRQENSYNRQGGGNYDRPRPNYSNQNYGQNDYGNRTNSYERRENSGYNQRNQRSYDNNYSPRSYDSHSYDNRSYDNRQSDYNSDGQVKKRRPRVGEVPTPVRNTNYNRQPGGSGYGDQRGGYQQRPQRPYGSRPGMGGGKPYNKGAANLNAKQAAIKLNKQNKYREENFDPEELIRLNKYLANAGICSRREADEFIQAGLVKVNGEVVTELGTKVKRADEVVFHNDPVNLEQKVYVLLNKPKNCVTTADDPQERLTVMDLVKTACHERIFPVGRLDRNTTGVLLLTNDGDLASKLTHPKFLKKKIYHVWLDKEVTVEDMQKIAEGVELEDGEIHADAISYVTEGDNTQVGVEIHSGRNRVVRRMFESLGYHVIKLDRVYFAGLTKKNLKRGQWRYLSDKEVSMLRMGSFD